MRFLKSRPEVTKIKISLKGKLKQRSCSIRFDSTPFFILTAFVSDSWYLGHNLQKNVSRQTC